MTRVLVNEGPAGYELRYRSGEYSAAKWFFMCLTSGRSFLDGPTFKEFAERARERIHEIEYPVRVGFGTHGMQYDWNSIEDVYEFANHFTGDIFEFGAWLKQYVSEKSSGVRASMADEAVTRAERQREEKVRIDAVIARKREEVGDENAEISVREIAEETGIPKSTVHDRLSGKSSIDRNPDKPSRSERTAARQLYLPADPAAAAERLVAKFGRDFSRAVAGAVLSMD